MKKIIILCDRCDREIGMQESARMSNGSFTAEDLPHHALSFDHLTNALIEGRRTPMKEREHFDLCSDCTHDFDRWFDAPKSGN